ncbi:prepilin peptidase [Morganella psychrotolerans]|uniref:prepilin peptidase n=1 Tax=Morganella psychrotolerans TaxID=368603 RepID=UPI0039AE9FB1
MEEKGQMNGLIMISWALLLPLPLKTGTEYILRHYYQYPQKLHSGWLFFHCLLAGGLIVYWSDRQVLCAVCYSLLFICLIILFHIDNAVFYLPDKLVFSVLWGGLLFQTEVQKIPFSDALYGVIAGFILLWAVAEGYAWRQKQSGLGGGDIKLFSSMGAWVGAEKLAILMLLACSSALVVYLLCYVRARYDNSLHSGPRIIAFGPHLIAGMIIVMSTMSDGRF